MTAKAARFNDSPLYSDWHSAVPQCWYDSPAQCAIDGECGEGKICFQKFCYDVRKYSCDPNNCTAGATLNPLRYCECIPNDDFVAMFCEPNSTANSGPDGNGSNSQDTNEQENTVTTIVVDESSEESEDEIEPESEESQFLGVTPLTIEQLHAAGFYDHIFGNDEDLDE